MEPLRTGVCAVLAVSALLVCAESVSVAQLGGRRALQTWVAQSGSFSVETGLVHPKNPVKSKTEMTWDHNAKPPAPEESSPPPPPAEEPPAEEKVTKGHSIEASFNKQAEFQAQVVKPAATKEVLVKGKPSVQVSVDVNKGIVHEEAPDSPPPEKETVYVIEKGHDSHCGCHNCACGH